MPLTMSSEKNGAVHVVTAQGEVDAASVRDFQKSLGPLLTKRPPHIVLDCKELKYINSRGIAMLVQGHRQAMSNRGMLVFIGVSPALVKVFDLAMIADTLIICESLEDALAKFA